MTLDGIEGLDLIGWQSIFGQIVESVWYGIPQHFPNADIDEFVVMPDHFHGIVVIKEDEVLASQACAHAASGVLRRYGVKRIRNLDNWGNYAFFQIRGDAGDQYEAGDAESGGMAAQLL